MSNYEKIKNEMINKNFPIKKVSLGEIKHLGENVYSIDGKDFAFTNESEILLDKKLDISIKTKRQLAENGGEKEIAKLRNWMLSRYKKDKILVSADENGNIANLLPLKSEIIPPSSFFQMVELFAENNDYSITSAERISSTSLSVKLKSKYENVIDVAKNEEFDIGGVIMNWDFTKIELNDFYIRMICTNGAVSLEETPIMQIEDMSIDSIKKISYLSEKDKIRLTQRFRKYADKTLEAIESNASLEEVEIAKNCLHHHGYGVSKDIAERLVNLNELEAKVEGIEVPSYRIRTDRNVWDLYNLITYTATHQAKEYEMKRPDEVIRAASGFLNRKRDIPMYIDI